jgi:hypothetical protein
MREMTQSLFSAFTIRHLAERVAAPSKKLELDALKRSALILAVAAWESFIEDTVIQQLDLLLKHTSDPAAISSIFNGVADEWLDPKRSGSRTAPDLIPWTGDKWKDAIRRSLSLQKASESTYPYCRQYPSKSDMPHKIGAKPGTRRRRRKLQRNIQLTKPRLATNLAKK